MANPDGTQQWLVRFDVLRDDWVIGEDLGLMWIDDQSLYVVGEHTSFAVPGHHLKQGLRCRTEVFRPLQRRYWLPIMSDGLHRQAIQLDFDMKPPFTPERIALEAVVESCARTSNPNIEGQLPPIEPYRNAHSRHMLKAKLATVCGWYGGALFLALVSVAALFEELRLNPLLGLAILAAIIYQVSTWGLPRLLLVLSALKAEKAFLSQASAGQEHIGTKEHNAPRKK